MCVCINNTVTWKVYDTSYINVFCKGKCILFYALLYSLKIILMLSHTSPTLVNCFLFVNEDPRLEEEKWLTSGHTVRMSPDTKLINLIKLHHDVLNYKENTAILLLYSYLKELQHWLKFFMMSS